MAGSNSKDPDTLGSDPQNDPQNNTLIDGPPKGQDTTSDFEHQFNTSYPFQTSVMSNLNRLDFRNLRLAGIRTDVSQKIQQKYLRPTKCDELVVIWDSDAEIRRCSSNTKTDHVVKPCHGLRHNGWMSQREKQVDPTSPFKYVLESDGFREKSNKHEGHSKSFNVCSSCHENDRSFRYSVEEYWIIKGFHTGLCRAHSLEYVKQRPYNFCRCQMFLDSFWRCDDCSVDTVELLEACARNFGVSSVCPRYVFNMARQEYISRRNCEIRSVDDVCPISGCAEWCWDPSYASPSVSDKHMHMCRACTAIFP